MDRKDKNGYLVEGMIVKFKEKPNGKLLNKIIGAKFKDIRLSEKKTAEAVVEDNKKFFTSIYDLYKFERGMKTDTSKLFALCSYYKYDILQFYSRIFN